MSNFAGTTFDVLARDFGAENIRWENYTGRGEWNGKPIYIEMWSGECFRALDEVPTTCKQYAGYEEVV